MANPTKAILFRDFDASQINFEPVSKNKLGGKMVRMTYGPEKTPLWLQTPEMYIPFDVSHHNEDGQSNVNFTFEVALQGYNEEGSKMKTFFDKITQLDEHVVNTCVERSVEWIGDKKGQEVVQEFYRKLLRHKNPKYSPIMKVKVAQLKSDGTLPTLFDSANSNATLDILSLSKGVRGKFILAFQSVWFVNKTFGVTAKLIQASVTQRPQTALNNYAFVDDDIEENSTSIVNDDELDV